MKKSLTEQQAKQILQEASRRAERKQALSLENLLFDKQIEFVEDPARVVVTHAGRRSGKSSALAVALTRACIENPRAECLYIATTLDTAKDILFAPMQELDEKLKLGLKFQENPGKIRFPNGSSIALQGCKDERDAMKPRGRKFVVACMDEVQNYVHLLEKLIDESVGPAMMDYEGKMYICGTPNASCNGYFYKVCHDGNAPVYHWTWRENPYMHDKGPWVTDFLEKRGLTEAMPRVRREWGGEWVRDTTSLVFDYLPAVCDLPKWDEVGADDWKYGLGIDTGFNDATAFAVVAYSKQAGQVVFVESFKEERMVPSKRYVQLEKYYERYPLSMVVCDPGSGGKDFIEEWNHRYPARKMQAAPKSKKQTFVEFMNDDFRAGNIKVVTPTNTDLVEEWRLLQWDDKKLQANVYDYDKTFDDHLCDAALYIWRSCKHHRFDPQKVGPKKGTAEYVNILEADRKRRRQEALKGNGKPWWKKI